MEINAINTVQASSAALTAIKEQDVATVSQYIPESQTLEPVSAERLNEAVSAANDIARFFYNTQLNFSVDNATKQIVVKVVDASTGEVIRQIPPEEMLRLIAHFDKIRALLFSKRH